MALIWTDTGDGWNQGSPKEYQDEAELHRLMEENLRMLPLDGSPSLTFLGSEVYLGYGYADILAVESTGRPVIIEVKLASNYEARSGIVSQILYYAAFLRGKSLASLERQISNLAKGSEHPTIFEAVQAQGHIGADDTESFNSSLQYHLERGDFRLVFALDGIPAELERIVAYLDSFTSEITIDLVTVEIYEVNGAQVAVPRRVVPDPGAAAQVAAPTQTRSSGVRTEGADAFNDSILNVSGEPREGFDQLIAWAEGLAELSHVRLSSHTGARYTTLSPRLISENAGLVAIYNDKQQPWVALYWSVIERCAPNSVEAVKRAFDAYSSDNSNYVHNPPSELLELLTEAYREAGRS